MGSFRRSGAAAVIHPWADVVVAQDGSGDFTTVGEAVAAAANRSGSGRYVMYVKAGTYKENVEIGEKLVNVMLLGDGIGRTIITGSRSNSTGYTTFNSPTVGMSFKCTFFFYSTFWFVNMYLFSFLICPNIIFPFMEKDVKIRTVRL